MRAPYWARRSPFDPFEEHHRRGRGGRAGAAPSAPAAARAGRTRSGAAPGGRAGAEPEPRPRGVLHVRRRRRPLAMGAAKRRAVAESPSDDLGPAARRRRRGPRGRLVSPCVLARPRAEDDGSAAQGPRLRRANTTDHREERPCFGGKLAAFTLSARRRAGPTMVLGVGPGARLGELAAWVLGLVVVVRPRRRRLLAGTGAGEHGKGLTSPRRARPAAVSSAGASPSPRTARRPVGRGLLEGAVGLVTERGVGASSGGRRRRRPGRGSPGDVGLCGVGLVGGLGVCGRLGVGVGVVALLRDARGLASAMSCRRARGGRCRSPAAAALDVLPRAAVAVAALEDGDDAVAACARPSGRGAA